MNLRLTGEYPDLRSLEKYPNWEYALDEEGIEGQDETTIRPSSNQHAIGSEVVFTAGFATLADGRKLHAILELLDGRVLGITVYDNGDWAWTMRRLGNSARWTAIDYSWVEATSRPPSVELSNSKIFPLRLESVLRGLSGAPSLSAQIP